LEQVGERGLAELGLDERRAEGRCECRAATTAPRRRS